PPVDFVPRAWADQPSVGSGSATAPAPASGPGRRGSRTPAPGSSPGPIAGGPPGSNRRARRLRTRGPTHGAQRTAETHKPRHPGTSSTTCIPEQRPPVTDQSIRLHRTTAAYLSRPTTWLAAQPTGGTLAAASCVHLTC